MTLTAKMKPALKKMDLENLLEEYTRRFPDEIALLRIGGVHPTEPERILNPYLTEFEGKNVWDEEDFTNVGEHCLAVAFATEKIANMIALPAEKRDEVIKRALVHDATKRYELMRKKAKKAGAETDVYSQAAYEAISEIMLQNGIESEVADYLKFAGKETGHNSLPDFLALDKKGDILLAPGVTLEKMIVHLADDMCHTPFPNPKNETYFVDILARMLLSDFPNRYPFLYIEGFGFNDLGEIEFVQDLSAGHKLSYLMHYAQWQIQVAQIISGALCSLATEENKCDPEQFWVEVLNS